MPDAPQPAPTFSVGRSAATLVILGLMLVGMIGRVAYLQTYGRENRRSVQPRRRNSFRSSVHRGGHTQRRSADGQQRIPEVASVSQIRFPVAISRQRSSPCLSIA